MIEFGEPLRGNRIPDLTPMIDVIFLLLIFFMLTSIYSKPVIPLDLPDGASAVKEEREGIDVGIDPDGRIFVNGDPVLIDEFEIYVARLLADEPGQPVRLMSDASNRFGLVISVMDKLRLQGAANISIVTDGATLDEK
ncbi:MAG TPA: biopolymer transporter ExbD [Prosthecochloris aestuarii]|uniref:Biopolymer transporter ExbD n=1 Tax=Prosthecochloris aestuarii TaxID=1102 RepID=A0A831WVV0_PROAE|nr:biopolymer transporter ExbD [Prosthecochloris sp.]HED31901.1 biopolymer transporter ExbD [Prosthecochloris aestuarii]